MDEGEKAVYDATAIQAQNVKIENSVLNVNAGGVSKTISSIASISVAVGILAVVCGLFFLRWTEIKCSNAAIVFPDLGAGKGLMNKDSCTHQSQNEPFSLQTLDNVVAQQEQESQNPRDVLLKPQGYKQEDETQSASKENVGTSGQEQKSFSEDTAYALCY